jgi:hypothetical protein
MRNNTLRLHVRQGCTSPHRPANPSVPRSRSPGLASSAPFPGIPGASYDSTHEIDPARQALRNLVRGPILKLGLAPISLI